MARKRALLHDLTGKLFDPEGERRRRDDGMQLAADNRPSELFIAVLCIYLAACERTTADPKRPELGPYEVCSDDIYRIAKRLFGSRPGEPPNAFDGHGWLGPASGSVWRRIKGRWIDTKKTTNSRCSKQQASRLTIWRLNPLHIVDPLTIKMPDRDFVLSAFAAEQGIGGAAVGA